MQRVIIITLLMNSEFAVSSSIPNYQSIEGVNTEKVMM
jgi:hypothetical protein